MKYCPECQKNVERKWDGFQYVCELCGYKELERYNNEI